MRSTITSAVKRSRAAAITGCTSGHHGSSTVKAGNMPRSFSRAVTENERDPTLRLAWTDPSASSGCHAHTQTRDLPLELGL